MNDKLNCITVADLLAKYPDPQERLKVKVVHVISGDCGDFVYYLPIVQYLYVNGFKNCNHYLAVLANRGQRTFFTQDSAGCLVGSLVPSLNNYINVGNHTYRYSYGFYLLKEDQYHDKVEYVDQSAFREPAQAYVKAKSREGIRCCESLVEHQFRYQLKRPTGSLKDLEDHLFFPFLSPYIRVPKRNTKLIAYANSGRYFSVAKFNKLASDVLSIIVPRFGNESTHVFVGTKEEYELLNEELRVHIRYYPTPYLYELVALLQHCGLLVCNQSFPFALAQAAETPTVLAESASFPDSIIGLEVNSMRALSRILPIPETHSMVLEVNHWQLLSFLTKFNIFTA